MSTIFLHFGNYKYFAPVKQALQATMFTNDCVVLIISGLYGSNLLCKLFTKEDVNQWLLSLKNKIYASI